MTDTDNTEDESVMSRRGVVAGVLAATGLSAYSAGRVTAQSAPEGEIGTSSNPYLRAWIDRQVYVGRTSDLSSPGDGTSWYREDL